MRSFKGIWGLGSFRLCAVRLPQAIVLLALFCGPTVAESCLTPPRPFVPSDLQVARDYADIIRSDFELYIRDIQNYFRCLDDERARAFEEAGEVSEEYGRFFEFVQP